MFEFGESEKENFNAVIKNKLSVYETISYKKLRKKKITEAYSLVVCLFFLSSKI